MSVGEARRARLAAPMFVLVTDSARLPHSRGLLDVLHEATHAGVTAVQIREKSLSHDELVTLARQARDVIGERALVFINGDVHAAVETGADGVHLPEAGMSVAEARAIAGDAMLISRAVHSAGAAVSTERDGADIVQLGTVFETASKPGVTPIGVDVVRETCAAVSVPVIAIGGITAKNAADVIRAGAAGVAVIGSVFDARDVRTAVRELRAALASVAAAR